MGVVQSRMSPFPTQLEAQDEGEGVSLPYWWGRTSGLSRLLLVSFHCIAHTHFSLRAA